MLKSYHKNKNNLTRRTNVKNLLSSLPFKLFVALTIGTLLGGIVNEGVLNVILSIRHISGQIVFFSVPLIIIGMVAPAIVRTGKNASRLLILSLCLAYTSSLTAAMLSMAGGYSIIPALDIATEVEALRTVPAALFVINIPPLMNAIAAMTMAIFIGLSVVWSGADNFANLLEDFNKMIHTIIRKIVIPILPVFIGANFTVLSYEGSLTGRLPMFLAVIAIMVAFHYIWLVVLYTLAGIYSKRNPLHVIKHYGGAWLTAAGTMSSAATMALALDGALKSKALDKEMARFAVPLFAHIHLVGSAISIVFLALTVSQVMYGQLPDLNTMLLYVAVQAVFTLAAAGVPSGTVVASMGLMTYMLGFSPETTALLVTIFALQDSFTTSTNILSDGAMAMVLTGYKEKRDKVSLANVPA